MDLDSVLLTGLLTGATGLGRLDATFSAAGEATNSDNDILPSSSLSADLCNSADSCSLNPVANDNSSTDRLPSLSLSAWMNISAALTNGSSITDSSVISISGAYSESLGSAALDSSCDSSIES